MSRKIIRFTASWCGPCQMLAMNLNSVTTDIPIEVIDIDKNQETAIKFNVRSVPTLIMVDGETEIARSVGAKSADQIQQWIDIA